MTARRAASKPGVRAVVAAMVALLATAFAAAFDRFDDLPGAERVRQLQGTLRTIGQDGRVGDVQWTPEGVVFRRGASWLLIGMQGGAVVPDQG
jgi:hypothetical protein